MSETPTPAPFCFYLPPVYQDANTVFLAFIFGVYSRDVYLTKPHLVVADTQGPISLCLNHQPPPGLTYSSSNDESSRQYVCGTAKCGRTDPTILIEQ